MFGKIVARNLDGFWERAEVNPFQDMHGVYIFVVQASRGMTPWYVGQATRQGFGREAFGSHQRNHYSRALAKRRRGKPAIFFVSHPMSRGKINARLIDKVETFLIDIASRKNPELGNVKKKPQYQWRIRGVIRAKQGEGKSPAAARLVRMLALR
jgi:hypothetical protein